MPCKLESAEKKRIQASRASPYRKIDAGRLGEPATPDSLPLSFCMANL